MFRWFKKYFIPNKKNNHKPQFLQPQGRLFVLWSILVLELVFAGSVILSTRTNFFAEILTNVLVQDTNASRSQASLPPLAENPLLLQAAKQKAQDMATNGYFAHVSPDGKTPWYWLDKVGYKFNYAGENLAVNFFDSQELANAWMNSPEHRANILSRNFTEIGIASAQGNFEGHATVFVVEFFGHPATVAVAKPALKAPPSALQNQFVTTADKSVQGENTQVTTGTPDVQVAQPISYTIQSAATSPQRVTGGMYFLLLGIIIFALLLSIFVKMEIQQASPILNGALMIIIIVGVVYVNHIIASFAQVL